MNNDTHKKTSWSSNRGKIRIYKVMLGLSVLALVLSVLYIIAAFTYLNGLKKVVMLVMPVLFAYFIFMYYTKIKQLK